MDDKERIEYLDRLNNNQKDTIVTLQQDISKLMLEENKYRKFLQDLVDECEGSLLPWQYKWVVQRVNKFLMETA